MGYQIVDIDEREYSSAYGLPKLLAKVAAASRLDETKIRELREPEPIRTSEADCVKQAAERIVKARNNRELVFIGGDYDADGICATAIMKKTLDVLGITNGYYIPDKLKEGYGLRPETVRLAKQKGYSLIITVDNGVKATEAIEAAHELGMEVIVTDHHVIEEEVPGDIVVHPDYMEEAYSTLSGAGVALQISRMLIGNDKESIVLAAVAAIGDVMPLWKQTRSIVYEGLQYLNNGVMKPFRRLVSSSVIDETTVAFEIVPKLNAISRMDDDSNVNTLVRYLLLKDERQIESYALQLEKVNTNRKNLSRRMTEKAEKLLHEEDFLLVYDQSFSAGVSGLVAGKIASSYHKPTLVFADAQDHLVGSARSVPGFNIYDFFSDFDDLLAFGGHAMAAGLSIPRERLDDFTKEVQQKMKDSGFIYQEEEIPAILCDADDITMDEITGLSLFNPYPKDIVQPIFALRNPVQLDVMKRQRVSRYRFANNCGGFDGVLFSYKGVEAKDDPSIIIGKPCLNHFHDRISCQLVIEEMR